MTDTRSAVAPSTAPTYDYSDWPILTIYMPSQRLSAEGFEQHLVACGEPYKRGMPFGMIIVMGEHPPLTAAERQASARAMATHHADHPGLLRGAALVVSASAEHGVVRARGWVANHDGNVSIRLPEGRYLATPTAVGKAEVTAELLVVVDGAGKLVQGKAKPFSEMGLHLQVYRARPDVKAVVHAHLGWRHQLFGDDLLLLPRLDLIWMGERSDFAGQPIDDHARLDVTMLGVVSQDFDLELRIRNVTGEHYALAVIDPLTGKPFTDPGELMVFALRWRFLN